MRRYIPWKVVMLWSCSLVTVPSQVVTPDGTPSATRLEQLESTYSDLLKNAHQPLLKNYLAALQAQQSKALIAAETAALKAEIDRVQAILAGKGIVEFDLPKQEPLQATKVVRKSGIIFSLDPDEATPLPANAKGPDAVVPMGTATWKLSSLPAGSYDIIAHYACPAAAPGAKLHVSFSGQEFDRELKTAQLTKDDKTFRVIRLCQFTIKQEAQLQNVVITATPAGEAWLFLKQVLIVKPKS
ncbi:MAG: hypothetical protein JWO08_3684 [Verrucomicrobiaceae bacterium]|nr:hypothetical protein [Verrucomicrobiaceae bacterium]